MQRGFRRNGSIIVVATVKLELIVKVYQVDASSLATPFADLGRATQERCLIGDGVASHVILKPLSKCG
jgi:hypothetical protein